MKITLCKFFIIILTLRHFVKKNRGSRCCRAGGVLLLAEGLAVGALVSSGVSLVGAHEDPVQGTVVLVIAVIGTLLNGTLDALVSVAIHIVFPPLNWIRT